MPIISNHNKSASSYPQVEKIYNQMSNENATVIDTQWMTPDELDVHVTTALDNNQKVVVMMVVVVKLSQIHQLKG